MTVAGIESLPVHLTGSDIDLAGGQGKPRRCRRAVRTRTFTLTANNPVEQILPQADSRAEAWFSVFSQTQGGILFISSSQAGAGAQAGGCLQVPFIDILTAATEINWYPLNTTDAMWASGPAAAYPVTISVLSVYEELE